MSRLHQTLYLRIDGRQKNTGLLPSSSDECSEKVIRQIIWKIISFFGTFFKVKYLLIDGDL